MAISSGMQWDIRTTGSDTNGGGYNTGGTDYSQQNAAQLALTDVVANGTTTLTSATAGFTSAMVGNTIYLSGGSGSLTATRREITGFTNSTTITVDATVASGTGITGNVGGTLLTIGTAAGAAVAGNNIHVKSGTYTTSGRIDLPAGGFATPVTLIGYGTTHFDGGTKPVLQASGDIGSTAMIGMNNVAVIQNFTVDSNGHSVKWAIADFSGYSHIIDVYAKGAFTGSEGAFTGQTTTTCIQCSADSAGFNVGQAYRCSGKGLFQVNYAFKCVAYDTGGSVNGFTRYGSQHHAFINCTAINCGGSGFFNDNSNQHITLCVNCIAVANGAYGYKSGASARSMMLYNCTGQGNTSGFSNNVSQTATGTITSSSISGDPLVGSTTKNPSLDNTAGEGAVLRGVAYTFDQLTSTIDYGDLGAVQHQDSGGGSSGMLYIPNMDGT